MSSSEERYPLQWRALSWSLTKQLSTILIIVFIAIIGARFYATDFNLELTFKHIPLLELPIYLLAIFAFSGLVACLFCYLLRVTEIKISSDGIISGRNYWLFKRSFHLKCIEAAFPHNSNGIPVWVLDAGKNGQIYVPVHVEGFDRLQDRIKPYLPEQKKRERN